MAQTHFNELCVLLEVEGPLTSDPTGGSYAFERTVRKAAGGKGFADVWKRGAFAWEYKGKGKNLGDAYIQLLLYRDDLENPPLLVVSDIDRITVHTNFTGTTKAEHTFRLEELREASKRAELRKVWTDPNHFDPRRRREAVTEAATYEIGQIALSLRDRGHEPLQVAHFMIQLVFALFAEDTGLLPKNLVSRILERSANPDRVTDYLSQLIQAMSTGGEVLLEDIAHFNGGLFDGGAALPLTSEEIKRLHEAALLNWADVEPAIFGTLFERSLDPARRAQLGAHYTSREDIIKIVDPVIVEPLRQRWKAIREQAESILENPPANPTTAKKKRDRMVYAPIADFLKDVHSLRVLDPACGSGNFLYVALQALKDLEHEAVTFAEQIGAGGLRLLGPRQFHGIEINPFAQQLTSMVIWIGYLQWNRANDIDNAQDPVLEPLNNIQLHDALMNEDATEFVWPAADYIVGNPPFLGDKLMRAELGDSYVENLRKLFEDRLPGQSDFVCYWFEKARASIEAGPCQRVGLIATNSIRGGANRTVLQRIKTSGDIFLAWSDEPWILNGAAVRVSIVGFDDGTETNRELDGQPIEDISSSLSSHVDVAVAQALPENSGIAVIGIQKGGPFDIPGNVAMRWLDLPNPTGHSNRDVLKPYTNGRDITDRSRNMWLIDFNQLTEIEAAKYHVPFAHVERYVRPTRLDLKRASYVKYWWLHQEPRPTTRRALQGLHRYLCTPRVSKHRLFVWVNGSTMHDSATFAFARSDDYFFGIVHSRIHEVWSLAQGTSLGVGNDPRYTPSTCFETFPFPEPSMDQHRAISNAARHLDEIRRHLLDNDVSLTMTKLYNEVVDTRINRGSSARAFPLLLAHEQLDEAVANAYGWEWPLPTDAILERLLKLNLGIPVGN